MILNILLSFLAGLLLNFMPCILPILSIKIYDIIKYSQTINNKSNLKLISLATIFGILTVFMLFSFIVFIPAKQNYNVGFHFQNPYFLIIVIFILFLFLLNLLNFFSLHYPPRIINFLQKKYENSKKLNKGIFFENYVTGIFMVLFATPCSIPIIGTAATLSIMNHDRFYIFYNFICIGIGMSVPFIVLLFYPNVLDFLKNKKKLLTITHYIIVCSLYITIFWLMTVLKTNVGLKPLIVLSGFLFLVIVQFKMVKKYIYNVILLVFIVFFGTIMPIKIFKEDKAMLINNSLWTNDISFDEIQKYIDGDKTVFVAITANWCIVCNFNELTVFADYDVVNFLHENNIVPVKIDISTNSDKAEKFYEDKSNLYVPNYIIYNKNHQSGCKFNGKLTKKEFFNNFEKCQ